MILEKTSHDEIEQILKLGRDVKVIPWTARASSRSKTELDFDHMYELLY